MPWVSWGHDGIGPRPHRRRSGVGIWRRHRRRRRVRGAADVADAALRAAARRRLGLRQLLLQPAVWRAVQRGRPVTAERRWTTVKDKADALGCRLACTPRVPRAKMWGKDQTRGGVSNAKHQSVTVVKFLLQILQEGPLPPTEQILNTYKLKTCSELICYYHVATGFPVKPT